MKGNYTFISKTCDMNLNKIVLSKASFFDKRFAQLKFLSQDEALEIIEEVKQELRELEQMLKELQQNNEVPGNDENLVEPLKKKRQFLGLDLTKNILMKE